jgi:hypothetical protein
MIIDRRAEPPDTFLEENHPMTISSNFVLIEQMVSDKKIFMGISHREVKLNCKNLQHVKIFIPCNFEVNPITHFGVIALFSSKCSQF